MPGVFVIMPFSDEFQSVYEDFLRPTLEASGFTVRRADDIRGQRNILQDVLEGIRDADLVVADLTGGNENVYYELGLSHGLNKPVVLLTQDIDEIPFDLQGYRHVEYDVHFARIAAARERLEEIARAFLTAELQFGSPVSDFLGRAIELPAPRPAVAVHATDGPADEVAHGSNGAGQEDSEWGLLDHAASLEEGYEELTAVLARVTEATARIDEVTRQRSAQMTGAKSAPVARSVARKLAEEVDEFSLTLRSENERYRRVAEATQNSLEFMIAFLRDAEAEDTVAQQETIEQQVEIIRAMREAAAGGKQAYADLRDIMLSAPKIERQLTLALARGAAEVDSMVRNIDLTIASADRALATAPSEDAYPLETVDAKEDGGDTEDDAG